MTLDLRAGLFLLLCLLLATAILSSFITLIWQRKKRQLELLHELKSFLEHAPIGIVFFDGNETIHYANATARWLLYLDADSGKLPDAPWIALLDEDVAQIGKKRAKAALVRTLQVTADRKSEAKGSNSGLVRWWIVPWKKLYVVFVSDENERQRTHQQMRLLQGSLAHEFRTPLATIRRHLEVLNLPELPETVSQQSLTILAAETDSLLHLVSQMLVLSRLENEQNFSLRAVNLLSLVEETVAQNAKILDSEKSTILIQASAQLPPVLGEPAALKQVFQNLLENAIKHGGETNQITIKLEFSALNIVCSVCDIGPGIAEQHIANITKPFYRANNASVGSGLGLAIVAELLNRHHSQLHFSSNPAARTINGQQGLCATFSLPILANSASVEQENILFLVKFMRLIQISLKVVQNLWWLLLSCLALAGYWLLPISGQVVIRPNTPGEQTTWPRFTIQPVTPQTGETISITVSAPVAWSHVLLTINDQPAQFVDWQEEALTGIFSWHWQSTMAMAQQYTGVNRFVFYYDCQTGCRVGGESWIAATSQETAQMTPAPWMATKLCVAFANPDRNWHGRSGWVADVTYTQLADSVDDPFWNVEQLAIRVQQAWQKGLRPLMRIDYDKGQTLPPADDAIALSNYLKGIKRLAGDARLRNVYAFIIGSGANAASSSSLSPNNLITPEWYARVFNGYGQPVSHNDNVVQVIRSENPNVRVLVGPVRPWIVDQNGSQPFTIDLPWLNYMNSMVAAIDKTTEAKATAGFALAGADGFALHVPGHPDAPELAGRAAASEPLLALTNSQAKGAQIGFQVYRDWLAIINRFPTTKGLPAYITSTNTFPPDGENPPAQNYPSGWLDNALSLINREPQIQSLCWFLDLIPGDDRWDNFSLTRQPGKMLDAAEDFDRLLQQKGAEIAP